MQAINYTTARKELARTMDRVCQDHDPVIITRNNDRSVVIISLKDYESLQKKCNRDPFRGIGKPTTLKIS